MNHNPKRKAPAGFHYPADSFSCSVRFVRCRLAGVADAGMRPKLCVLEHRPSHVDFLSVINYNKMNRDKMKAGRNNEE